MHTYISHYLCVFAIIACISQHARVAHKDIVEVVIHIYTRDYLRVPHTNTHSAAYTCADMGEYNVQRRA